jgi:cysteinyl-tRNA synthetase
VYNYQHVGNYRTYVFEDILVRTLKLHGYKPNRVMNITDVGHLTSQGDEGEDKMEVGAAREGKSAWDVDKVGKISQYILDAMPRQGLGQCSSTAGPLRLGLVPGAVEHFAHLAQQRVRGEGLV